MVLLRPTEPPLAAVVVKRFVVVIVLLFVTPLGLIGLGTSAQTDIVSCTVAIVDESANIA